jgi:hypothetical protein
MGARLFRIFFVIIVLLGLAIAFAPASLFIPQRHGVFTYDRANGTIWQARFEGAKLASLDAGAVDWKLSVPDLFQGRMNARVVMQGADVIGHANLLAGLGGDRRLMARMRINRASVGRMDLEGATTIDNLDISFADGRCTAAGGRIATEIPSSNAKLLRWRGPNLTGAAACSGDAALLTLQGEGEGSALRSVVELHANGEAVWRADVRADNAPRLLLPLRAAGFQLGPEGKTGSARRAFRWFPF